MRLLKKACQAQLRAENDVLGVKGKLKSQIRSTAAPKHRREEGAEPQGEAGSHDHKIFERLRYHSMSFDIRGEYLKLK